MTSGIKTVYPDEAKGLRRLMMKMTKRQMGGRVPGIQRIVMTDFQIGIPTYWLYGRLNLRKGSPLSASARDAGDGRKRPRRRSPLTGAAYDGRAPFDEG